MEEGMTHPAETWDFGEGDIWYFRPNEGHMVQGLAPSGCTYLAGYNSGTFYDPDSPSLGAWLEALPADIKAEGLGVAHLQQKTAHRVLGFITQGPEPTADLDSFRASVMKPPQPAVKLTHRYQLSQQAPKAESEGGSVIVGDKTMFPISEHMSGALVRLRPGGMRQLHWHTNLDEWQYVINGTLQAGVFNYTGHYEESILHAGDAGFAPVSSAHYFKNVGDEDCFVVLMFNDGQFTNIDATALVGNMPAEALAADLGIPEEVALALDPTIPTVAPPLKPSPHCKHECASGQAEE
ncbi:g13191 [Coccomyxa viridis]|uniref:G13191 protein n=1 Tax=Coccomyxa viridis TaxID=1274662 RepID=A0ABP1GCI2_9CHLO